MSTTYFTPESVYKGHIVMGVDGKDTCAGDHRIMFSYAVEDLCREVNSVSCYAV